MGGRGWGYAKPRGARPGLRKASAPATRPLTLRSIQIRNQTGRFLLRLQSYATVPGIAIRVRGPPGRDTITASFRDRIFLPSEGFFGMRKLNLLAVALLLATTAVLP